jgi:hypothetical protein
MSPYSSSLNIATDRQGTLGQAWNAFAPVGYGEDLARADSAISQLDAEAMCKATSLAGVYGPMYRLRTANAFTPGSFRAIPPPLPAVDQTYLDAGNGNGKGNAAVS